MKITKTITALTAAALLSAGQAQAATAYMGGLLGATPGYSTITGPNGERVSTAPTWLGGDERVSWNNISQTSAVNAQIRWLEQHQGEQNTLWVYSATANSINKVAATRPELLANTTVIAIAPPRAGSLDYAPVPVPSTFRQYQAIVDGDSVADEDGTSFDTHTNGYRNLNMQTATPITSTVTPGTNTRRSYYYRPGTSPATTAPTSTWAERAEARREARAQRRAESREAWTRVVRAVFGKPDPEREDPETGQAPAQAQDDDGAEEAGAEE